MALTTCFECGKPAKQRHHVVPRCRGGSETVPLCDKCHAIVHAKRACDIGELTRKRLQEKKNRGERIGHVPYGFCVGKDGKHLEPHEDEQRVIAIAATMRSGGKSWRQIANDLNAIGLRNRNGNPWNDRSISRCTKGKF